MIEQATVARPVEVSGTALRSGAPARARLRPGAPDSGVVFLLDGIELPATIAHVIDTTLATTLGGGGVRVVLVEHLLAATLAAGVDNLRVELDGDELPILDGGALQWLGALARAGRTAQPVPARWWSVSEPVRIETPAAFAMLEPATTLTLDVSVSFSHPQIGAQRWAGDPLSRFGSELAWARTFGFQADAERFRAAGMVRGVSLDNTLVFDDVGALNEGGQRAPDEVVRHKALDALGDLALLPGRPRARMTASRGGHAVHHALLRAAERVLVRG
ncbi:MAG: UDP-3-O-[3-hydroxymyristoyl] N-acetylglucosamine deacetylase [Myxococcales bacterium]|nr:UDP-3-O-[3-hydroxymyristoyl] N-acetylglucosamine deacetylase [Myxococcales bacterium]